MIKKLLLLLVVVLVLISGYGEPLYPPTPPPGILYGNIVHNEPITVIDATRILNFAKNIHQQYLNRPYLMTAVTGDKAWHEQWVYAYKDMIDLINRLEKNQGEVKTIMIIVTDEGIFTFEQ